MPRSKRSARERATRPALLTSRPATIDDDPDAQALAEERHATAPTETPAAPPPAPVPFPSKAPIAPPPAVQSRPAVRAEVFTVYDADALWDWCRLDPDGVRAFFGHVPSYAAELHERLSRLTAAEEAKLALLRTVWVDDARVGFVLAFPITPATGQTPPIAHLHYYLAPESRGSLPTILPALLDLAAVALPGATLSVITDRPEMGRLLQSFGFTQQIVLTRSAAPARPETSHGDDRR